ncbi:MAG: hypothetical protein U0164_08465 [Gemmatimonadaceae bacterium]
MGCRWSWHRERRAGAWGRRTDTRGGRQLANAGAIFTGSRRPQQARIDLMLALGAGLSGDALRAVFDN